LKAFGELVLCQSPDLLVASVGALADRELEAGLHRAASASGGRLLIPGGALGGIDAISAAREAGLTSVLAPYSLIHSIKKRAGLVVT
jgi:aspartate dehydrogenase